MKIALVCRRYHPEIGGVETHVKEIAERLAKNHEIAIFTLVNDKRLEGKQIINGICIMRFKSLRLSYAAEFPPSSMLREIESFGPQIIHSHSIHTTIPYFASRVNSNSKFVITPHYLGSATSTFRGMLFSLYKPFLGSAMSKADRIICTTSAEKEMTTKTFVLDQTKIQIIPNGVGSDLGSIIPRREGLRILSVARLDLAHKKTDKLIRAFKILESKIDAKLVLVGDGPDKQEIIKLVKELGLAEKVEVKSNLSRDELIQEYSTATIFVTASEMENFGIAVAEALAARLRVIVPNSTALAMYVKDGYASGMQAPITPEKIAQSILVSLQESAERSLSYSPYTWDMAANDLEKLYRELEKENC